METRALAIPDDNQPMRIEARLTLHHGPMSAARRRAGLTQMELARRVGVCALTINKLETLQRSFTEDLAYRVGIVLECLPSDLLEVRLPAGVKRRYRQEVEMTPMMLRDCALQTEARMLPHSGPRHTADPTGAEMRALFHQLNEDEQKVMLMRFGLPPYAKEHTFEEIGDALGLTKGRAQQIRDAALYRLRKVFDRGDRDLRSPLNQRLEAVRRREEEELEAIIDAEFSALAEDRPEPAVRTGEDP